MGIFDKLFGKKSKPETATKPAAPKVRVLKQEPKSEKELATSAGEPYVAILKMDIDPNNLHQGVSNWTGMRSL
jgi:hypothetical protein